MERFNFDGGLVLNTELLLGSFDFTSELLNGSLVLGGIFASLLLEDVEEVVHNSLIEIFTSQVSVSIGGFDFKNSRVDGQDSDIKSTTTKIKDKNILFSSLLVKTIRNGSSSWLVNNTKNVKSGDGSSILGSLSLSIIEICRASNNGVGNLSSKVSFSSFLHFGKNHSRNFFWRIDFGFSLKFDLDVRLSFLFDDGVWVKLLVSLNLSIVETSSNESLNIEDSVFWVQCSLVFGSFSNKSLGVSEGNI
mmetsp:Transcript_25648/g.36027  ORF Transcript_25648/g.36027 Transcript_25648/m.36027 type:complete len:248 (+) Transcript_25648:1127-1870(+)